MAAQTATRARGGRGRRAHRRPARGGASECSPATPAPTSNAAAHAATGRVRRRGTVHQVNGGGTGGSAAAPPPTARHNVHSPRSKRGSGDREKYKRCSNCSAAAQMDVDLGSQRMSGCAGRSRNGGTGGKTMGVFCRNALHVQIASTNGERISPIAIIYHSEALPAQDNQVDSKQPRRGHPFSPGT